MFDGLSQSGAYSFIPDDPPESVEALAEKYARQALGQSRNGKEIWLNWIMRVAPAGPYIGYIQATVEPAAGSACIAYHVFPTFWRRGYACEAVTWMIRHLAVEYDLAHLEALIDTRNTASIGLVEKLGFIRSETLMDADYFKGAPSHEYKFVYFAN